MAWSIAIRGMAALLVLPLAGCSFFGIDTRPDIEYATVTERRPVKEPMYQRQIPGTNLVKRWPARLGLAYGYAPWETKKDAVMVSQDASAAGASAAATAAPGGPSGPSNGSPSARGQAKSRGSQVNLAANWAPRNEAEPIKPKSHLRPPPPPRTPVATQNDEVASPTGLIQPRTIAPAGATAHAEVTATAADEAVPPPHQPPPHQPPSNLPNVYDPSDQQPTPEDELPGEGQP